MGREELKEGGWWREVGAEGGRGKLREGGGLVDGGGS